MVRDVYRLLAAATMLLSCGWSAVSLGHPAAPSGLESDRPLSEQRLSDQVSSDRVDALRSDFANFSQKLALVAGQLEYVHAVLNEQIGPADTALIRIQADLAAIAERSQSLKNQQYIKMPPFGKIQNPAYLSAQADVQRLERETEFRLQRAKQERARIAAEIGSVEQAMASVRELNSVRERLEIALKSLAEDQVGQIYELMILLQNARGRLDAVGERYASFVASPASPPAQQGSGGIVDQIWNPEEIWGGIRK
ncbi:hypothetical protein [Mesorhizobium sp. M0643]|uniref:hypothetical protein n=1 Tax=Mesorhizobium sp. M0643 TaxID=2956978 RepID=UPI003335377E